MNDKDWIGRLVEFRDNLTLGESFSRNNRSAIIYQGRIKYVFRKYARRKHHRAQFRPDRNKIQWSTASGEILIRYKGPKWKPVKI